MKIHRKYKDHAFGKWLSLAVFAALLAFGLVLAQESIMHAQLQSMDTLKAQM